MTPHLGLQRIMIPSSQVSSLTTGSVAMPSAKGSFYDGPYGSYDALASFTVPSGGLTSVTFAGVPSGYKHLQVRYLVRLTRAEKTDDFAVRFNGDSATNYSWHLVGAVSTSGSSYTYASANSNGIYHYEGFPAAGTTASVYGIGILDIADYSTTKNKTVRILHGFSSNGDTKSLIQLVSGNWRSSNEIDSITFSPVYGSGIAEASQFSLYGVK